MFKSKISRMLVTGCLLASLVLGLAAFCGCDGGSGGVNVGKEEELENPLEAPGDFTVAENGDYSFDAVENADYYYLTIYRADDATPQSDYIKLQKIDTVSGQTSYSGNIAEDLGFTDPGFYSVQAVAYPVRGSSFDHSYRSLATYGKAGVIETPSVTPYKEEEVSTPFGGAQMQKSGGIAYDNNYGDNAPLVIALDNKEKLEGGKLRVEVFADESLTENIMTEEMAVSCTQADVITKTLISKDETSTFYVRLTALGDGTYITPAQTESVVWSGTFYTLSKITY